MLLNKTKVKMKIYLLAVLLFGFNGCLTFNKIAYEIILNKNDSGTANVVVTDLRSDAKNHSELEEDKNILFDHILKSDEFIKSMKDEGKDIFGRELYLKGDTLIAESDYKFSDINIVEGIVHEDGFYYLTLELADSVISTNGTIIKSKNYKRILWDDEIKTLKFEMLANTFENGEFTKLSQFFKASD
jgi:hypothetical protein